MSENRAELEQFLKRYVSHNVIVPFYDDDLFNRHKVLYVRFRALSPNQRAKYLAPVGVSPVIYGYDRTAFNGKDCLEIITNISVEEYPENEKDLNLLFSQEGAEKDLRTIFGGKE